MLLYEYPGVSAGIAWPDWYGDEEGYLLLGGCMMMDTEVRDKLTIKAKGKLALRDDILTIDS
jgi:hypothetical protein